MEKEMTFDFGPPIPNGTPCPECGKELWDSEPRITLHSNPPQKSVHCPSCGYRGYRTVEED